MARANTKQLTLHFSGEHVKILDRIREQSREAFRTPEQQALFALNEALFPPDYKPEPFDPAELIGLDGKPLDDRQMELPFGDDDPEPAAPANDADRKEVA